METLKYTNLENEIKDLKIILRRAAACQRGLRTIDIDLDCDLNVVRVHRKPGREGPQDEDPYSI